MAKEEINTEAVKNYLATKGARVSVKKFLAKSAERKKQFELSRQTNLAHDDEPVTI